MLENDAAGDGLAAARDFFAINGEVWAVFGVSTAEIRWYPQKAKRIGYCFVNFEVNSGYVGCAQICGFGDYAVGDFTLEIMVNCAAAADTPNHIHAQLFAGVKVNLGFWVLVFANAHGGRLPTVKPQSIGHLLQRFAQFRIASSIAMFIAGIVGF